MKKVSILFLAVMLGSLAIPFANKAQAPEWTQVLQSSTFGVPSVKVVTSNANNVFMACRFSGPIVFDGTSFTSIGGNDLLLAAVGNTGVTAWVKQFHAQPGGTITPDAIKADASGNIYLAATFTGTVTIGGSTVTSNELRNAFMAKFSSSGEGVWATGILSYMAGRSEIALDGSGNIYLLNKTSQLVKFSSAGEILWDQDFPVRTLQTIAVYNDNLYLGGCLQSGTTHFGSIALTSLGTAYNTGFMVKADLDGFYNNSVVVGGSLTSDGSTICDIATDNAGNLFITGGYTKNLELGGITITNPSKSFFTYIAKCDGNFGFAWVKSSASFSNPNREMWTYRIFLDNSGNIYESGMITGNISYGSTTASPGTGNQFLFRFNPEGYAQYGFTLPNAAYDRAIVTQAGKILIGGTFDYPGAASFGNIYLTQYSANLLPEWQKVSSGNVSGILKFNYIKHDPAGNTYLQARVIGYCDYFGTVINTDKYLTVISKHDITGNMIWMNQVADISPDLFGSAFTLDKDDNVITTGLFNNSLNIGNVTLTTANSGYEGYVAKYNGNGGFLWAAKLNLNADVSSRMTVTADLSGNIIVSGVINPNNYLLKFNASGTRLWAKSFPMESYYLSLVSADAANNIYLASEIHLDNGTGSATIGTVTLTQTGEDGSTALVKFDPNGNALWAKTYGGVTGAAYSDGWPCEIKTDSAGNTVLWGWCRNNSKFGQVTLVNPFPVHQNYFYYLARINTSGNVTWAKAVYEKKYGYNYGSMLDVDHGGNIYIAGHLNDDINIEGTIFQPEGTNDFFAAKYSGAGVFQWIKTIPANTIIINSISLYDEDILSISGYTGKNPTLGSFNITDKGGSNCMIATMALPDPDPNPMNMGSTGGSSVTFNIFAYSSWTAASDQPWLTLSSTSGTGTAAITFTATENPTTEQRTATVTITIYNTTVTVQTITVIQAGASFGISDADGDDGVIYPNPAQDHLFFSAGIENPLVSVYDVNGIMINHEQITGNKMNINGLRKGLYTIQIVNKSGVITRKFIKQ